MSICVNGQIIPEAAIKFELDRLITFHSRYMSADKIRGQMPLLKKKARDQAIGAKLLIAEAEKLNLVVPDDEVERAFGEMVKKSGGKAAFDAMLQKQGLNEKAIRVSIRRGKKVDRLVARITEGVADPTEEEILAHFKEHRDEYAKPPRSQAQHILVKPHSDSEADRSTAKAKLLEIRERIEEGEDFAEQAAAHSECPSGRRTGGSLGWFSRGMMIPEFDSAVFSMSEGELSGIVETPLGYHLIRKIGAEEGGPAEFEEVREKIRDFLRHVRRGEVISAYVDELRKTIVVEDSGD